MRKNKNLGSDNEDDEKSPRGRGSPAPCPFCGMIISNPYNLSCHIRRHQNIRPFKCNSCPSSFVLKSELSRHVECHNAPNTYKCSKCPKSLKSLQGLRLHEKKHDMSRLPCRFCNLNFSDAVRLRNHEKTLHLNKKLKCKFCFKHFADNSYLEKHVQTAHEKKLEENNETNKETNECGSKKRKKTFIKPVQCSDKNFKFYACKICCERFQFRKDQLTHYQVNHKEAFDKEFKKCGICDKLLTKLHYPSHMLAHTGNLPISCHFCDYKTARKVDLRNHMVVHTKEFKHKCQICNKGFRHFRLKLVCERRHSGIKNIKCKECEKTFFTEHELRIHQSRKHINRTCVQCGFQTCDTRVFSAHKNLHKNVNDKVLGNLMCEKCGLIVSNKTKLTNHVKKVHESNFKAETKVNAKFCSYCNFQGTSTDIFQHCLKVHPSKVHACKMCSYSTLILKNFNSHVESQVCLFGSNDIDKQFSLTILECFICGFTCVGNDKMGDHFDLHRDKMKTFPWYSYHESFDLRDRHETNSRRPLMHPESENPSFCLRKNSNLNIKLNLSDDDDDDDESQVTIKTEQFNEYVDDVSVHENNISTLLSSVKQENSEVIPKNSEKFEIKRDSQNNHKMLKNKTKILNESISSPVKIKIKKFKKSVNAEHDQSNLLNSSTKLKESQELASALMSLTDKVETINGKPFIPLEILTSLANIELEHLTKLINSEKLKKFST